MLRPSNEGRVVAILLVLWAGVLVPAHGAPATPLCFSHVRTTSPVVALTFDCCQTQKAAGYDAALVDFLVKHKVPATFFLGGRWIEAHPQAVKRLASIPFFELENHTYLHPHMTKVPLARVRQELSKTQQLLQSQTGRPARFLRPPFGEWDQRLVDEAARAGMQTVTWNIETGDPDPHASVKDILDAVHKAKPGSIIIQHANGRGWKSAQALPQILAWLKAHQLKPVTLRTLVALGKPAVLQPKK